MIGEEIKIRKDTRDGANYRMYELSFFAKCKYDDINRKKEREARLGGTASFKDKVFNSLGELSITEVTGSRKFIDEIMVQVYGQVDATERIRIHTDHDRIEIFFPREAFIEACRRIIENEDKVEEKPKTLFDYESHT